MGNIRPLFFYFIYFKSTWHQGIEQKTIYHMLTWSMPHFGKNGFFMSFVQNDGSSRLYDHIYILTLCIHNCGCQLTCNTLVFLRQVPRLLYNSPPPHFLLCPHSLLLLLSHFFSLFYVVITFFLFSFCCCCCC